MRRKIERTGDLLVISGQIYNLAGFRRVEMIAIGKASCGMSSAMVAILGDHLAGGLVVAKRGQMGDVSRLGGLQMMDAAHPIPDESSLLAGQRALEVAASLSQDDLLICLISGGGSALVTVPVEGVSLADLQALTSVLMKCGASIQEINVLRRALDRVKGGGLARAAGGAEIISLVISDVMGDHLEAIASGPTFSSPTTAHDALIVLERYGLTDSCPPAILSALNMPSAPHKAGIPEARARHFIVASNLDAVKASLRQAESEGLHPHFLRTELEGEARWAGARLAKELRRAAEGKGPMPPPACLAAGGETTVTVTGRGRGGRNTELALAACLEIANLPDVIFATLATDGEDGQTDAAGAVVTGETRKTAQDRGLDPQSFLMENDSYSFFSELDDLIKPGPTGTNVNDLVLLFYF